MGVIGSHRETSVCQSDHLVSESHWLRSSTYAKRAPSWLFRASPLCMNSQKMITRYQETTQKLKRHIHVYKHTHTHRQRSTYHTMSHPPTSTLISSPSYMALLHIQQGYSSATLCHSRRGRACDKFSLFSPRVRIEEKLDPFIYQRTGEAEGILAWASGSCGPWPGRIKVLGGL